MGDLSKHFSRHEFACKCGCGFATVDYELLVILEKLREHLQQPITIVSGCRCSAHNAAVGGARDSQHMKGRAADIQVALSPELVHGHLATIYRGRYGLGKYPTFTHIDTRSGHARW